MTYHSSGWLLAVNFTLPKKEILDILELLCRLPQRARNATLCKLYWQKCGSTRRNEALSKMPMNVGDIAIRPLVVRNSPFPVVNFTLLGTFKLSYTDNYMHLAHFREGKRVWFLKIGPDSVWIHVMLITVSNPLSCKYLKLFRIYNIEKTHVMHNFSVCLWRKNWCVQSMLHIYKTTQSFG